MRFIAEIVRDMPERAVNQPMAHASFKPVADRLPRLPSLTFYDESASRNACVVPVAGEASGAIYVPKPRN
jgi:hypothetical protein